MPYIGKGANGFGIRERYRYSATSSQTAFTGSDLDSKTLNFDSGSLLDVYLNGVLLDTADYNTSTANTVTLTSGATASDEVMIVVYDVFSLSDAMPKTGGTFTGAVTHTGAFTSVGIDDNADATAITIDSSERVGIGTTSPAQLLHVKANNPGGKIRLEMGQTGVANTDVTGEIQFYHNDASGAGVNADIKGICTNSAGAGALTFGTGTTSTTERMRIDSNGNLGIGTTSPNSGYRIHAYNSSGGAGVLAEGVGTNNESFYALKFVNSGGTSRNALIKGDNGDLLRIATPDAIGIRLETSDSEALLIGSDGSLKLQHVYDDTTSFSANMYIHSDGTHQVHRVTSSERYKKDIETLEDKYADAVLGLRPVWYKSKCEADNPDHSHWGLIAEEVAEVDPRLVTFRNEYTEDIGDGEYKVVKLDAPQAESVQYDRFVPHLINICKRQEDKITALEAKVKALEEA